MQHNRTNVKGYLARSAAIVLAALTVLIAQQSNAAQQATVSAVPAPDLRVEYLGSDHGFAVTNQTVTVLCVIRNTGNAPLPENTARVRCYPLTGLDFMEGQLWPYLPALNPKQAVAFRWHLALADQNTPLVFSVLITTDVKGSPDADTRRSGGPQASKPGSDIVLLPRVVAAPIPRFAVAPHLLGAATSSKTPQSSGGRMGARVGNDRTVIHIVTAQDRVPLLVMAGKDAAEWKSVAIAMPCLQILSSEEGQNPWWESFRWNDTDFAQNKDAASVTLSGAVGANWTAQLTLESRSNTAVVYGRVLLKARRTVKVFGIQLPRLLGSVPGGAPQVRADGSAAVLGPEVSPFPDDDRLSAAHAGALTYGITWPAAPPLPDWRSLRLPMGDSDHLPVLGGEWSGNGRGDVVLAGATIELPFRLFVFGPSDTVQDAARFRIP